MLFNETGRKGNVLFNDTLNTFYLRLYGVGVNKSRQYNQQVFDKIYFSSIGHVRQIKATETNK